jgi:hypothetical protein
MLRGAWRQGVPLFLVLLRDSATYMQHESAERTREPQSILHGGLEQENV